MNVDPLAKRNASYSSCQDVCKYISELGISKVLCINKGFLLLLYKIRAEGLYWLNYNPFTVESFRLDNGIILLIKCERTCDVRGYKQPLMINMHLMYGPEGNS